MAEYSDFKTRLSLPRLYSMKSLPALTLRHTKGQLSEGLLFRTQPDQKEDRSSRRMKTWMTSRPEASLRFSLLSSPILSAEFPSSQTPRSFLVSQVFFRTAVGSVNSQRKTHNQDCYFEETQNNCRVLGICDGHGPKGHLVSRYVAKHLPSLVFRKVDESGLLNSTVCSAYTECADMLKELKHDLRTSGCACLSIVLTTSHLLCANLGHARAVTGRIINGIWSVYQLSTEHRPDQESELSRILSLGGEVSVSKRIRSGPPRIYIKGTDYPGLCISRAFGDTSVEAIGLLHEPEVIYFQPTCMDKFLLLGTFGLWEVMSSLEAVKLAALHLQLSPENVPGVLVLEAQRRWKEKGGLVDDITVVMVLLD